MNRINRRALVIGAVAGLALWRAGIQVAGAQAMDPAARRIQVYYSTLLPAVLQARGMSTADRARRITQAVLGIFDIGTMVRVAVGPPWSSFTGKQQAELRDAFARFTVADYASQLNDYAGEAASVEPVSESRGADRLVKSRIGSTTIDYLVRGSRVIDVYANGTVSELANRRAEFASILSSGGGAAGLIDALQQRTKRLLAG